MQNVIRHTAFFHKPYKSTNKSKIHTRNAGLYAVFAHKGNTASHVKVYKNILKEIESAALTIISPMYIYDLMSNFVNPGPDEYATKYCVQVNNIAPLQIR